MVDDFKGERERENGKKKEEGCYKRRERTIYDFHKSLLSILQCFLTFPLINIYEHSKKVEGNKNNRKLFMFSFLSFCCCRTTRSSTQLYHNQHFNDIDEFTLLGGI